MKKFGMQKKPKYIFGISSGASFAIKFPGAYKLDGVISGACILCCAVHLGFGVCCAARVQPAAALLGCQLPGCARLVGRPQRPRRHEEHGTAQHSTRACPALPARRTPHSSSPLHHPSRRGEHAVGRCLGRGGHAHQPHEVQVPAHRVLRHGARPADDAADPGGHPDPALQWRALRLRLCEWQGGRQCGECSWPACLCMGAVRLHGRVLCSAAKLQPAAADVLYTCRAHHLPAPTTSRLLAPPLTPPRCP